MFLRKTDKETLKTVNKATPISEFTQVWELIRLDFVFESYQESIRFLKKSFTKKKLNPVATCSFRI